MNSKISCISAKSAFCNSAFWWTDRHFGEGCRGYGFSVDRSRDWGFVPVVERVVDQKTGKRKTENDNESPEKFGKT